MVLADRSGHGGADGGKFNGTGGSGGHGQGKRRAPSSPGNNNNGQLSDDSNNSDDSDHGMRVGSDYQAVVPDSLMPMTGVNNEAEKAVLVWSPCNDIPEAKLDEYLTLGKEKYSYNHEQALGMLCWHKFNLEKALSDLPNFTPFPDEWTVEDKVLFEQAFQFHDKHFHKIRQMLPDKSIASLVKYYYSWKKTRSRTSLMDRQARKLTSQKEDGSEAGSFAGSDNESESGQVSPKDNSMVSVRDGKPICSNCGTNASSHFHNTNKGLLCRTCYSYWRRTGFMKNASSSKKHDAISIRHTQLKPRKPPRGMHLLYEDLESIANGPPGQGESILKNLDSEVVALKRQVQNNKQMISQLKHKACLGIDKFRPAESSSRINARWTNDELLLGVQGVRKYGKDFKAIAEVIGNKTEAHVRSFFCTHSRRYDLESVLKEFELENGVLDEEDNMKESPEEAINQDNVSDSASLSSLNQASTSTPSVPPPLKPISSSSVISGSKNNHKATLLPQAQPPPPLTSSSSKSSKP